MLGPMFGDWGAIIAQFVITAVVVLGLVGVVYWLMQRYSAAGLGRIGRGRVRRLAIIDAMSIDGRRRLVLVRRDNVEHLLLIGGPSDVVVEQAIQRQRRARAPGAEGEAAQAAPASEAGLENSPVPFAQPRPPAQASYNGAQATPAASERPFSFRRASPPAKAAPAARATPDGETPIASSPAKFIDIQLPTAIEADADRSPPAEESEPLFPDLPTADLPIPEDSPSHENGGGGTSRSHFDTGEAGPAPAARSPYAKPESGSDDTRGKLADLENEMARLLGEITQKRHS